MQQRIIKKILAHAEETYPEECCGVVIREGRRLEYVPCRNAVPDTDEELASRRHNFVIDPEDLAAAEDRGEIVCFVHSHPDDEALPSHADMAACDESGVNWLIASWPEGDIHEFAPRIDRPYIGRQFVLGYSDCWSLVRDYYRREFGIELHNYSVDYHWWEQGEKLYEANWFDEGFREYTGLPQDGDLVIMQIQSDQWNHGGVLTHGGDRLLHHLYGRLSAEVMYTEYYQQRTVKILRHKDRL